VSAKLTHAPSASEICARKIVDLEAMAARRDTPASDVPRIRAEAHRLRRRIGWLRWLEAKGIRP
jgi:hypothetical protein